MKRKAILIMALAMGSKFAFSQTFDKTGLDNYFQTLETGERFMGSVAISQNGKIIYSRQIGFSDVDNKIRLDENTKFRIGSITKTFTAVLVFKAIEEGKIKLTDKIDKYFPTIKNAKKISIGNLLSHRSGIHNFTTNEDYPNWETEKKTEEQMTEIIIKGGSDLLLTQNRSTAIPTLSF